MSRFVFALDTTSVRVDGLPITVRRGEARHRSDPVVRAHPEMFADEPVVVSVFPGWKPDAEVEQATAAPGEKRATRRAS